jgi:hypothetical protein
MKKPLGYKEWVEAFVKNVSAYFNFAGWNIDIVFHDEDKDVSYAETKTNSAYQNATIHLYKVAQKDFDEGKTSVLVMTLVHELCHIFFDPLHSWAEPHLSQTTTPYFMDTLEQQTQKLTMVLLKNLPKGLIPPR